MNEPAPPDRKYSLHHTWARPAEAGCVRVGITRGPAVLLGDAVHLELPATGVELLAGEPFGLIESSWVVFELVSPVSGTVVEVNPVVTDFPERVTADPYGDGWLMALRLGDASGLDSLASAESYEASLREGEGGP
jgi:glycine cleavage system H protein